MSSAPPHADTAHTVSESRAPSRLRLRDLSITAKLAATIVVFVGAVLLLLAVAVTALEIANGVRAYVAGEGLWSKGQKDGVYFLTRYLLTHDEVDYRAYREAIAIPLGDHIARLELQKPSYNPEVARAGFIQGGNAPEDVPAMIRLFRCCHALGFFAEAIRIWSAGDDALQELQRLGDTIHAMVLSGTLDATRQSNLSTQIEAVNARLTPLERRFSATLGAGARHIQHLLLTTVLVSTVVLLTLGLFLTLYIANGLRQSILGLRAGALRMTGGDLSHRIEARSRDELGQLASVFNEMMERRRAAEEALRAATDFRDKVMRNATNAIYVLDLEGRFRMVNRRTCEVTGFSEAELLGMPYPRLIPPANRAALHETFLAVVRHGESVHGQECPLIRADGNTRTIAFSAAPLYKDDAIFALVGAAEDITERRQAQIELAARAEELARSNKALEQFAYVASHDLQEPLRSISGFAQLLRRRYRGRLGAEADEFIDYIIEGAQRMKSLIEDLLSYSRLSRRHAPRQPVALDAVLDEALSNLRAAIAASGAHIERSPMPTLPGDRVLLLQLFQNLLSNAIKFRGERPPHVRIDAQRDGEMWHCTVRDNGIGIEPQHVERIFEPFQRLHARESYPGNGIGLTICKRIIELHGGHIWVDAGQPGAVFHFTLPAVAISETEHPPTASPSSDCTT